MINNNEEYIDLKNIDYELLDIEFIENSETWQKYFDYKSKFLYYEKTILF